MAIKLIHAQFLLSLRAQVESCRTARSLMDIGEQNWFGREPFAAVIAAARGLGLTVDKSAEDMLLREEALPATGPFEKAKLFFRHLMGIEHYEAIDLHGTKIAKPINLNLPYDPPEQFDIVLNMGTTEHVFNQFEAFNSIHKLCKPGGLMIHVLPMSGGREHGFFNYHATTFFDLGEYNGYKLMSFAWKGQKIKDGEVVNIVKTFQDRRSFLEFINGYPLGLEASYLCFQKAGNTPFACPMQAVYDEPRSAGPTADDLKRFWIENR